MITHDLPTFTFATSQPPDNLLHCAPFPSTPSSIFQHATTLLKPGGWISFYGAFREDDGGFGSEGDRKVSSREIGLECFFGSRWGVMQGG
jgi:hypothetical protein